MGLNCHRNRGRDVGIELRVHSVIVYALVVILIEAPTTDLRFSRVSWHKARLKKLRCLDVGDGFLHSLKVVIKHLTLGVVKIAKGVIELG